MHVPSADCGMECRTVERDDPPRRRHRWSRGEILRGGGAVQGELIHESSGQIIGTRVLPSEGGEVRIEVTAQGQGTLCGKNVTTTGTYWQTVRPDGGYYGEGEVVFITDDGEVATWRGFGVGRPTGAPPAASFATVGAGRSGSPSLSRVNSVATVGEYEVEASGRWTWRLHAAVPAGALAGTR
jgi:hypothetical protein